MPIEAAIIERISQLIDEGDSLRLSGKGGSGVIFAKQGQDCRAWLVAAANLVQILISDVRSAYRTEILRIASKPHGGTVNFAVGNVRSLLVNLLRDIELGLVASVADHARAEIFDDFLDHARAYLAEGRTAESGVIAGVVFEDSLRRVCQKNSIAEQGRNLDALISELVKSSTLSDVKAKRARVAAHVRTKATHAQWKEFDESDVRTTIEFTDEFIATHLDQ